MTRFLGALESSPGHPGVLSEAMIAAMVSPPPGPIKPKPNGAHFGMGWDAVTKTNQGIGYGKNGGLLGVHSWIEHTPEGVDWAILWNGGKTKAGAEPAMAVLRKRITDEFHKITPWPTIDLETDQAESVPKARAPQMTDEAGRQWIRAVSTPRTYPELRTRDHSVQRNDEEEPASIGTKF